MYPILVALSVYKTVNRAIKMYIIADRNIKKYCVPSYTVLRWFVDASRRERIEISAQLIFSVRNPSSKRAGDESFLNVSILNGSKYDGEECFLIVLVEGGTES